MSFIKKHWLKILIAILGALLFFKQDWFDKIVSTVTKKIEHADSTTQKLQQTAEEKAERLKKLKK